MTAALVILDRDGVINHDAEAFIKSPEEWRPVEGSPEAIARLTAAGVTVAVATNQSGLGRHLFDVAALTAIHKRMRQAVESVGGKIDRIVHCPHLPEAGCRCRKPQPGMLLDLVEHYGVPADSVPFVGDSVRDIQAARAAGLQPVLVLTGNGGKALAEIGQDALPVFHDLAEFVDAYLTDMRNK